MKKSFLLFIYLLASGVIYGQTCIVNLTFNTQASIDNFSTNHSGCTVIDGTVAIGGADITNLDGISSITSINGKFNIDNNPLLSNISGIEGIVNVGGDINIENNPMLTDLHGLHNLSSIRGSLRIVNNNMLVNIEALSKITVVNGFLSVGGNPLLATISGLENITTINGALSIGNNNILKNLNELNKLTSVNEYIAIIGNPELENLYGLINVTTIRNSPFQGYINISSNDVLTSLAGLDNINVNSIEWVRLSNSNALSYCGVKSICQLLDRRMRFGYQNGVWGNAVGCQSDSEIVSSGTCQQVLPVTLVSFKGKNTLEGNLLTWQTTSETNNKGFAIERSINGANFEQIGFVNGNGNITNTSNYSFTDVFLSSVTYYRLKQLDWGGTFAYSKVIVIKTEKGSVVVYPNPSKGQLYIKSIDRNQPYKLMDKQGFTVLESSMLPLNGLNTSSLQDGMYLLQVGQQVFKVAVEK
jgi:hypothetical protein